jgi:peptidoglycan/LPS O-acetylase OafA/YrhL
VDDSSANGEKPRGSFLSWLARRLSRETSSGRFIPQIDGLRFVAIAMVVLYHLNGYLLAKSNMDFSAAGQDWLQQTASVGFHGVELFFVISGFILALPFAAHYLNGEPKVELKKYYLRRLTRLEPPYILAALLLFIVATTVQSKSALALLPHLGSSLVYLHNLIYGHTSPVIGVGWSLEIEIQFYLLVPFLALIFAIRKQWLRRTVICGLMFAAMGMQLSALQNSARFSLSILAFLQFFLAGFLLADIYLQDWKRSPAKVFYWDVIALVGWPLLFVMLHVPKFTRWCFPVFALVLYCSAFRGRLCSRLFSLRGITVIGGMCYSIYLIHYEVISAVARFTGKFGEGLPYWIYLSMQMGMVGTAVLLICGTYFVLIEKPCMRRDWPQRLLQFVKTIHAEQSSKDQSSKDQSSKDQSFGIAQAEPPNSEQQDLVQAS